MQNYKKWDFFIFSFLTLLSLLNGQTTIFYLIYFFWWNELIHIVVDTFFYRRNPNAITDIGKRGFMFGSFIQMGIYLVFIVVFFGIIANWKNKDITITNMSILLFKNWFFNLNLILILVERIYLHKIQLPLRVSIGMFTPNMIVLHISIILGAIMMFFVVKKLPSVFSPENLWGSVIITLPFMLVRLASVYFSSPDDK